VTGPAGPGRLASFLQLTKFSISAVATLSAGAGHLAGCRGVRWGLASTLAGTLLMAMAASALNQVQERDLDARMERTRGRPLPRGALGPGAALALALGLGAGGFLVLLAAHGRTPALLGLLAMAWYHLVYTPLKRVTAFAVVPGSVVGALPPAMGWSAAGGELGDPANLALCWFFFLWQVPHFWLLALLHRASYEQAGLPTLARHFRESQILRLIFVWTCAAVAACGLLRAAGTVTGVPAVAVLALASLWLLAQVGRLLRPGPEARIRGAFRAINTFVLVVMAAAALG